MSDSQIIWIDEKTIVISGFINEHSVFDVEFSKLPSESYIKFEGMTGINSCGVREWIRAIKATRSRIHYVGTPAIMIRQFSMITGFFGENSVVDSLEAYFICDSCDKEVKRELVVGTDVKNLSSGELWVSELHCIECREIMVLDHDPRSYFRFLKP